LARLRHARGLLPTCSPPSAMPWARSAASGVAQPQHARRTPGVVWQAAALTTIPCILHRCCSAPGNLSRKAYRSISRKALQACGQARRAGRQAGTQAGSHSGRQADTQVAGCYGQLYCCRRSGRMPRICCTAMNKRCCMYRCAINLYSVVLRLWPCNNQAASCFTKKPDALWQVCLCYLMPAHTPNKHQLRRELGQYCVASQLEHFTSPASASCIMNDVQC
jgi:hypothetical protein